VNQDAMNRTQINLCRGGGRRNACRGTLGATFAELMLATLVVGSAVVASTASLRGSTEVYHFFAEGPHEALMLAQEIHEAAVLLPWVAGEEDDLFGEGVAKLDDLDGLVFDPPRSAEYEVVISHENWSQEVDIKHVDLADPSIEIDPDTFVGDYLTELEVTHISEGEEMGVHSWWMADPSDP
jgi:hypothetical protein